MSIATDRVSYAEVEGASEVFTPEFLEYIVAANDKFADRAYDVRKKRQALLDKALKEGVMPAFLPASEATTGDWQVPTVPEELKLPGIEISGPISIANMAINAVNPGPEGERAVGYLDDDEDSGGALSIRHCKCGHQSQRHYRAHTDLSHS